MSNSSSKKVKKLVSQQDVFRRIAYEVSYEEGYKIDVEELAQVLADIINLFKFPTQKRGIKKKK